MGFIKLAMKITYYNKLSINLGQNYVPITITNSCFWGYSIYPNKTVTENYIAVCSLKCHYQYANQLHSF